MHRRTTSTFSCSDSHTLWVDVHIASGAGLGVGVQCIVDVDARVEGAGVGVNDIVFTSFFLFTFQYAHRFVGNNRPIIDRSTPTRHSQGVITQSDCYFYLQEYGLLQRFVDELGPLFTFLKKQKPKNISVFSVFFSIRQDGNQ